MENYSGALFREQRNAKLYLHHPYWTPIIGWRHGMERLDLDDALAFSVNIMHLTKQFWALLEM